MNSAQKWKITITDRAHPPFSVPRTAPIQGVPTPRSPVVLVVVDELSEVDDVVGGVEDRLHATSNGSFTPK